MEDRTAERMDGRLVWRCRRGVKELDVLFERFLRDGYRRASSDEREAFSRLLELPDPDLTDYFFGHAIPTDPQIAHVARLIANPRP